LIHKLVDHLPRQKEEKRNNEASETVTSVREQAATAKVMVGEQDELCEV
jgi:hypothetical protein